MWNEGNIYNTFLREKPWCLFFVISNLQVESLYPDEMGPDKMSVEDFLAKGLPLLDKDIEKRFKVASSNGNVLRYVCMIEGSRYFSSSYFSMSHPQF